MIRSAMAVLALVLMSGFALPAGSLEAQEARTHEVARGETLWGIAMQYYGNGRLWSEIYEANRDRLADPDDLEVGVVLSIPYPEGVEVGGVTVMTAEPSPAEEEMAEEPAAAPQEVVRRPARRTVFFPDTANPTFVADFGPALSAVSRDAVYSAPWLVPVGEAPAHMGRVVGFAGAEGDVSPRESARPHDRMLVTLEGAVPAVGSLVQVFRVDHDVVEVGSVVTPTGVLRVTRHDPAGVVAVVEKLYGRLAVGDWVGPVPDYPIRPGDRAASVSGGAGAEIIGFANPRPIYSVGDVLFLDQGASDGVRIGDEYVVIMSSGEGWTGDVEGSLQVVALHPDHASARIIGEQSPIFQRGVMVQLSRRMR